MDAPTNPTQPLTHSPILARGLEGAGGGFVVLAWVSLHYTRGWEECCLLLDVCLLLEVCVILLLLSIFIHTG